MFKVRFKGTKEFHTVLAVSRDQNGTWFLIYREGRWIWVDAGSFKLAEASTAMISVPEYDLEEIKKRLKEPGRLMPAPREEPKIEILPRWIPVEEALPEPSEVVLIHANTEGDDGHYITIGQFCRTSGTWEDFVSVAFEFEDNETVTHWMPLPAPPVEAT